VKQLTSRTFFQSDDAGATAVECGLITAGIAVAVIVTAQGLGTALNITLKPAPEEVALKLYETNAAQRTHGLPLAEALPVFVMGSHSLAPEPPLWRKCCQLHRQTCPREMYQSCESQTGCRSKLT